MQITRKTKLHIPPQAQVGVKIAARYTPKFVYIKKTCKWISVWNLQTCSSQRTRGDCRWDTNGDALGVRLRGEWWCLIGDFWEGIWSCGWECVATVLGESICSNVVNTSDIRGLTLASVLRHCKARLAAIYAPFWGYCPPNLVSIIRNNLLLSPR